MVIAGQVIVAVLQQITQVMTVMMLATFQMAMTVVVQVLFI